ncbi:hypothetical protein BDV29DRAFT_102014 [Aspergillus leporis]|uniref:Secreted protein n=1 Tax=Aspergillus leporis TaxID=41062 RepID=A0A5N5X6R2_9EURO|nr:hypothetical protein BDV29DRAFT_102014 [Aspergillus leporis]
MALSSFLFVPLSTFLPRGVYLCSSASINSASQAISSSDRCIIVVTLSCSAYFYRPPTSEITRVLCPAGAGWRAVAKTGEDNAHHDVQVFQHSGHRFPPIIQWSAQTKWG